MNNNFKTFINLLRADGSIIINKKLAKNIGLHEAIIYSELISRHCYFEDKNLLDKDGYFCNTIKDLEMGITISEYSQRKSINKLIKMIVKGQSPKRYFKIVDEEENLRKCLL